ncbi:hypothetical protein HWV62_15575 [Athelia sp. TMB]|nr:hypothetical protein HWV62_15575 [Athelia sp. TMB]
MASKAPNPPNDLTVAALISAKGAQLKLWVHEANKALKAARQARINKKLPVEVLRARLAAFYGLDLSVVPAAPVTGPAPIGEAIRRAQWDHLRSMGAKWKAVVESGGTFNLLAASDSAGASLAPSAPTITHDQQQSIDSMFANLMVAPPVASSNSEDAHQPSGETLEALLGAARAGDEAALERLSGLRSKPAEPRKEPIGQPHIAAAGPSTSHPPPPPTSLPANAAPSTTLTDTELLDTCSMDIDALNKVHGLVEVIAQVKSGAVQRMRDKYGPQKGRKTLSQWARIKVTVNRRERVFEILQDYFDNDEARFLAFFQLPPAPGNPTSYLPYRKVAGAIPHMKKDVEAEKKDVQYQDPESGEFSDALWQERWPGKNDFEVWRLMGKESYEKV